jgi:hypothetical protein
MSEPKPEPQTSKAQGAPAEDGARVREQIGEGLRKFYDSVLDEPIPDDWLHLFGETPREGE